MSEMQLFYYLKINVIYHPNKAEKSYISLDVEKHLTNSISSHNKIPNKLEMQGNFP